MSNGSPITIRDGSFEIETDEELERQTGHQNTHRPHKYKHRNGTKHIRRVVVKRGSTVLLDEDFAPRECVIDIEWRPKTP